MTAKKAAKTDALATGSHAKFLKYTDGAPEVPKLIEGEPVQILGAGPDAGSFNVLSLHSGNEDISYTDELSPLSKDEAEELLSEMQDELDEKAKAKKKQTTKTPAPAAAKKAEEKPMPTKAPAKPAAKKAAAPAKSKLAKPEAKIKAEKKAAAPAKVKVPKPEKVEAPVVVIEDTAMVKALLRNKDLVEAIREVEGQKKKSDWALGGLLSKLKREKAFVNPKKGYTDDTAGFTKFLNDHFDTDYRRAQYFISNYEHYSVFNIDESRLAAISYTKLDRMQDLIYDDKTAEKWLKKAEAAGTTIEDLTTEIKKVRLADGTTPAPRGKNASKDSISRIVVKVFNDQEKTILKAFELAKKKLADGDTPVTDGAALNHICAEWLSLA